MAYLGSAGQWLTSAMILSGVPIFRRKWPKDSCFQNPVVNPGELWSTFAHHMVLVLSLLSLHTPQPRYNTIVGVQSINHVSYTTVLYPNKNV